MAIILDAMGSDNYPVPEIDGAIMAARELNIKIILVGSLEKLEPLLIEKKASLYSIDVIDAPDILEMTDKPVEGSKKKPNNSMAVGMQLLKDGKGDAFVSAGNTGGVLFNAIYKLKRLNGVQRPALTAVFPTKNGRVVVLDIGANADCRPDFFVQFGLFGSVFAEKILGINNPRVAMLSNGEEDVKGNLLIKEAKPLMQAAGYNFIGNVEPKEAFAGEADVIVTDGFTGNVFLKTSEAVGRLITDIIKEDIKASPITTLGGLLVKPAFKRIRTMMDPSEVGAARLLGVNGLVFIGHGRSDSRAIYNGIKAAYQDTQVNLLSALQIAIENQLNKQL
jgi:glycerol-3-phosphate acyltransferase PlsX